MLSELGDKIDLMLTPWKLSLTMPNHPLEVFMYFASPGEARDQEVICIQRGWTSKGVEWYN